jgi:uncharacterized protein DUF4383
MSYNDSSIEKHSGGTTYDVGAAGLLRLMAGGVGLGFLVVGVLGFVPGITTGYDQLTFAGHHSGAELAGVFEVSVLHNLVHVAFGILGVALASRPRPAALYLVGGGVVYAVLWVYGLAIDPHSRANFVPLNTADNWLHLALAALMLVLGVVGLRRLSGRRHGPSLA